MTVDGATTLDTVRAMARGGLSVPESLVTRPGREGRNYIVYGPLLPLVSLPGYFLGSLFDADPPAPGSREIGRGDRFALATNQWVSALLLVFLYRIAQILGVESKAAFGIAALAGVSTMILPYSRDYFSQPLAAMCLMGAAYGLIQFQREAERRWIVLGSCCFGSAVLARVDMLLCLPGLGVWFCGLCGWGGPGGRGGRSLFFWSLAPLLVCLVGFYLFDVYRWDSWAGASYGHRQFNTPLIDSLPRFFLSPELSVFLYNPLLLLSVPMFFLTWNSYRWAWMGILLSNLLYLVVVSKFQDYHGGICPGPRYLLSLVPINLIPLLAGIGEKRISARVLTIALVPLVIVGVLMNAYSAVVDYTQAPGAWEYWTGWFGL